VKSDSFVYTRGNRALNEAMYTWLFHTSPAAMKMAVSGPYLSSLGSSGVAKAADCAFADAFRIQRFLFLACSREGLVIESPPDTFKRWLNSF
jgi:hypothetical protein